MRVLTKLMFLTVFMFSVSAGAETPDWIEVSDRNALYVLEQQGQFNPENNSQLGLNAFDGEVIDLGPELYERERKVLESVVTELEARYSTESHPKVRQDLSIMINALRQDMAQQKVARENLIPFIDVHAFLFFSFNALLDPRTDAERYPAALERLARYTGRAEGHQPITELARSRTQERFGVEGLVGPFRGELEDSFSSAPRYVAGLKSLFERANLDGWEQDFAALETQLDAYLEWLKAELRPRARDNNQLPEAVYASNLIGFGVDASPAELIEKAQYSYQLIRSEMKALAWRIAEQRGWDDHGLVPVMRALKAEQVPQDEVLELYKERLAAIEDIIRREQLVTLPERDANIRLATDAESSAIPASFMSPPQLVNNTGQYGEFVLVTSNPALGPEARMDDWSHDAITWALTVHEARPGHELQFASLVENGTSLARSQFAFNSANAEGWGLYAESIMQEFLPLEGQLFNLFTRLMRAARMFLDPMVNTGQLTRDEAEAFLMEQAALSKPMAASEADRYAFRAPGQATSYYWGYMNLMRLRTEVEIALGDEFDQLAFHDFILEQGLLPPELLRQAVLERFLP